jgi:hypothetical protein
LIAGESDVLTHVGLSLLLATKRRIMGLHDKHQFTELVQNIRQYVDPDAVANTAVGLWEKPFLDQMNNEEI